MPGMISGQSVSDGRKVYLSVHYILVIIFSFVLIGVGIDGGGERITSLVGYNLYRGLIAMGFLFLTLVGLGFYAAYKHSKPGQVCYHLFLALLSIILIAVGGAILNHKDNAASVIDDLWPVDHEKRLALQYEFTCCGLKSFNDTLAGHPCPTSATLSCESQLTDQYHDELSTQGSCSVAFGVLIFVMAMALLLRTIFDIRSGPNATWVPQQDETGEYRRADGAADVATGAEPPVAHPVDDNARTKVRTAPSGYGTTLEDPLV